ADSFADSPLKVLNVVSRTSAGRATEATVGAEGLARLAGALVITTRLVGALVTGVSFELQLDKPKALISPTATIVITIRPGVQNLLVVALSFGEPAAMRYLNFLLHETSRRASGQRQ